MNCQKWLLLAILLSAGITGMVSAELLPEPVSRSAQFWPADARPPFATVQDSGRETVIVVPNAAFDPMVKQPDLPQTLALQPGIPVQYMIVQFTGPITETHKEVVSAAGLELLEYVPHFAFIARVSRPNAAESARNLPAVRWVGPYQPAYRIAPTVGETPFRDTHRIEDTHYQLSVTLFDGADLAAAVRFVEALGVEVTERVETPYRMSLVVRAVPAAVVALAQYQDIRIIHEIGEYYLNNDETQEVVQSGSLPNGTPIWSHNIRGENQVIAVMDSGLDPDHCFFYDSSSPYSFSSSHRKIVAYDEFGGGNQYDNCTEGHGTHVSGTAAGYPYNGTNSQYCGVAYNAKLAMQDIGADTNCSSPSVYPPADLTAAYTSARFDNAYIHTNSWGGSSNEYNSYCEDADDYMWDYKNFLILFSAGNAGPSSGTVSYPGTAKNIICVGGSDNYPYQAYMYNGSSRGPVDTSNRMAPTLTAPAIDTNETLYGIHSAASDGSTGSVNCGITNDYYFGTSMACPAVAGCAALFRQYYMEGFYPSGAATGGDAFTPTAALLKASLINSTANMTGDPADRPSNDQGWGRVLLDDTMYFSGDSRDLYVVDNTTGISTGNQVNYTVNVASTSMPLKFTLVWTDRMGNSLVNDLDLRVTRGATTYRGNNFSGGWSTTGTSVDHTNPAECVFLNSGTYSTGTYTVTVYGYSIPSGEPGGLQPFALVVSGDLGSPGPPTPTPTGPTPTPSPSCDDVDVFVMANTCATPTTNFGGLCSPDSVSIYVSESICPTDCSPGESCRLGWDYSDESAGDHYQYFFTDPLTLDCTKNLKFDMCYGVDGWGSYLQADFYVYWRCADSGATADCSTMGSGGPSGDWQMAWSDTTNWTTECSSRSVTAQAITIPCSCDTVEIMIAVYFNTYMDAYSVGYFRVYYNECDTQCSPGERDCVAVPTNTPVPPPTYTPVPPPTNTPVPPPTNTPVPPPTNTPVPPPTYTPVPPPTFTPAPGTPTSTPPAPLPVTGPVGIGILLLVFSGLFGASLFRRRG